MKDNFDEIYLNIILEAEYDNEFYQKYSSYKGIDIYINLEHVKKNLKLRYYNKISLNRMLFILKRFIKELLAENHLISKSIKTSNPEISYTVYGELSKAYLSGRFKSNKGIWRCYFATVLPPNDPYIASTDLFRKVKA